MVLVQLTYIGNTPHIQKSYNVNLQGVYRAKIIDSSFVHSGGGAKNLILAFKSPQFNFQNSSVNGYVISSDSDHVIHSSNHPPEFTCFLSGVIDLRLENITTANPDPGNNSVGYILSLDLEKLNEDGRHLSYISPP